MATSREVVEVAVGVIRKDQEFLLAKRPEGKPYAGFWEFPGGKLEKNETIEKALNRELQEELGIEVVKSVAWEIIEHDYPHAYVRLNLFQVTQGLGDPTGLEGQDVSWQRLGDYKTGSKEDNQLKPLLPATVTIIEMLLEDMD